MNSESAALPRRRGFRGRLARPLMVLVSMLCGCGKKDEGVVLVASSVVAPPILRSEAEQIQVPVRIDAPLRFENRSRHERFVTISKTGCSCYGMATADTMLKPGERTSIPAGGARSLYFVTTKLEGEGVQAFRAGFSPGSGDAAAAAPEELRADCSMTIVPDLVLEPAAVVIDVGGDQPEAEASQAFLLTMTQVTRGRPAETAVPRFVMSPGLLKAGVPEQDKPPVEISGGLWRTVWKIVVTVEALPDEVRENGGRFGFNLEFPESPDRPSPEPEDRRVERGIPRLLDVVTSRPQHQVSGQMIVRRSRGIIAPPQLHFGAIAAGGAPRTRRLVLTAADHKPFRIEVGEIPADFEVDVDSPDPAEQQWVTVRFSPASAGDVERILTLRTTHPDHPEVRILLKSRVQ